MATCIHQTKASWSCARLKRKFHPTWATAESSTIVRAVVDMYLAARGGRQALPEVVNPSRSKSES